uniref:Uncharacterized protein n=1 Tax=Candidatus Kentrum sp. UNK TaxID=2126344 RepID=A0A451B2W1_9GAMM|nr:MAG: hypothetical protein BECKUNK1418G_GA0071005_11343 [Candidatus Kentron sp. UNK]VFK72620.1 MAG: hypothetical protein BECKUNK1418H_GA0071006_11263 [Candidatus Kentron sp. UNK]
MPKTPVDFDDLKRKTIGWGERRRKTPLASPGRALDLAVEKGEGWLKLRWTKPQLDGGKPIYLQYPLLGTGRRVGELEYGVIAANKAGEGPVR